MKRITFIFISICIISILRLYGQHIIEVEPNGSNDIQVLKQAIEQAKTYQGEEVIIKLGGGTYHLNRSQATILKYYINVVKLRD